MCGAAGSRKHSESEAQSAIHFHWLSFPFIRRCINTFTKTHAFKTNVFSTFFNYSGHRRPVSGTRELWILCTASEKNRVQSPESRLVQTVSLDVKRDLTTRYPFEIKTPERTNSLSYPKAERTNSQAKLLVPVASLPCALIALAPLKRRTLGPGQQ